MPQRFPKDPNAELDYYVDWSTWLGVGEEIIASDWEVPTGLTNMGQEDFTTTQAVVWLAGGTVAQRYTVTNRISTNQGRTDDRSLYLNMVER